jgi:hypothetical protein
VEFLSEELFLDLDPALLDCVFQEFSFCVPVILARPVDVLHRSERGSVFCQK